MDFSVFVDRDNCHHHTQLQDKATTACSDTAKGVTDGYSGRRTGSERYLPLHRALCRFCWKISDFTTQYILPKGKLFFLLEITTRSLHQAHKNTLGSYRSAEPKHSQQSDKLLLYLTGKTRSCDWLLQMFSGQKVPGSASLSKHLVDFNTNSYSEVCSVHTKCKALQRRDKKGDAEQKKHTTVVSNLTVVGCVQVKQAPTKHPSPGRNKQGTEASLWSASRTRTSGNRRESCSPEQLHTSLSAGRYKSKSRNNHSCTRLGISTVIYQVGIFTSSCYSSPIFTLLLTQQKERI